MEFPDVRTPNRMLSTYEYRGQILYGYDVTEEAKRAFRHRTDAKLEKIESKTVKVDENMTTAAWQSADKGSRFSSIGQTVGTMPAGEFVFEEDTNGRLWAAKQKSLTDNIIDLPDLPTQFIVNQIENFWSKKNVYAEYKFLQKRGILLYGPPGCGKSSIIALLKKQLVDLGGLIFGMGEDGYSQLIDGLKQVRNVEPERPVMTIVEDLETYLEGSNGSNTARNETDALSLYDGENQINHVVHIATTNKPEVVADRFIRRPGRFDLVIGLHAPTRNCREVYLRSICQNRIAEDKLNEILDKTKGLSLAYMREIATTFLVLDIPLDETVTRLKQNAKQDFSKEGFSVGFGFEDKKD